jgi:large conductance mechanosensitive channel
MLQEFKKFVLRGNVVDLAVGVVMGAAFTAVVTNLVGGFITPLIGAVLGTDAKGKPRAFSELHFLLHGSSFKYGLFINAAMTFILTAAVVFFLVVKPLNQLMQRMRSEDPPDPTTKKCPECLSEIPIDARRCAFCTTELAAA